MNYGDIVSFAWCVVGVFTAILVLVFLFNVFESIIAAKIEEKEDRKRRQEAMDKIVDAVTNQIKESMSSNNEEK